MKNFLKSSTLCALALVSVSLCAAVSARAQTRDDRLISAKAGGVNLVAGDVRSRRAGGRDWQGVTVKDDLKDGDSVRTGADGRVEVLLNPGSYLRAGASTEFELTDSSLDNLRLRVTRGSVLVEAMGYDSFDLSIQIYTPQARVEIVRAGVYRVDVTQAGETLVAVQKGRALVGDGAAALVVKGGKEARVAGGVEVVKLQKRQRDELELWSRERGKELAKVNGALANRQTNTMLASYHGISDIFRADFPSSYGFWMWSSRTNCYTFLPFYAGWRSPYGFGYGSSFNYYDYYNNCIGCPARAYRPVIVHNANPPYTYTPNTTTVGGQRPSSGGSSTGTSTGGSSSRGGGGGGVASPPPSAPVPVERGDRIPRERTVEPGSRP
ncbi:MAG TPA: FecR domain-containing protein [Pyrinomonadaceae bacterium]|nr:FecR domain-containing protein [Pyrinomonadaceae bacterium]